MNKNVMAIDIGLNNLCALSFRYGLNTYLINGRPLKSYNRNANYQIDQIQSGLMKQLHSSKMYYETEEIRIIRAKRDNFITNYFHQASKLLRRYCITRKV
jgi:putative transposase